MSRKMLAWGPVVLWALGLFLLSEFRSTPSLVRPLLSFSDKLVHFALYFTLGGLLARARRLGGQGVPHAVLIALGGTYGALDEWHQSLVPGRSPEIGDWLADVSGVLAGYLLVTVIGARKERSRIETNAR